MSYTENDRFSDGGNWIWNDFNQSLENGQAVGKSNSKIVKSDEANFCIEEINEDSEEIKEMKEEHEEMNEEENVDGKSGFFNRSQKFETQTEVRRRSWRKNKFSSLDAKSWDNAKQTISKGNA